MKRLLVFLTMMLIAFSIFAFSGGGEETTPPTNPIGTIRDLTFSYVTSVEASTSPTVHFYLASDMSYSDPKEEIPLESVNTDTSWGSIQYRVRYNHNGSRDSYKVTLEFSPFKREGYDPIGYEVLMYSLSSPSNSKSCSVPGEDDGSASVTSEALSSQTFFAMYYRFKSDDIDLLPADKEFYSSVTVTMEAV